MIMNAFNKIFLCYAALTSLHITEIKAADFVIFSYDRPIQLYALLESTEQYLKGIEHITVLYRASNSRFEQSYQEVYKQFPTVNFLQQGTNPRQDFKPLFLQACNAGTSNYILFAPDDIIVKNHADLDCCAQVLQTHGAYAFFLRLGTHLNYNYPHKKHSPLPPLQLIDTDLYSWTLCNGTFDWGYPNNVDMTLYRKDTIMHDLSNLSYINPNTLEAAWAGIAGRMLHKTGLCFEHSIVVNIPVNRVQNDYQNNFMNSWNTLELLELFEAGKKIDIQPLSGILNTSSHMEYELTFIQR